MTHQIEFRLPAFRRGIHLITDYISAQLPTLPEQGLLHVFLMHTSAGLIINENADPTVLSDMETFFDKYVPENQSWYCHTMEGSDDMPAHIKTALTGTSVTIPIRNGRMHLGTWQGIYLCEYRNHGGERKICATVMG
ncbi:MAG TPA: secondary thiamine-phosphate synthase enzyme YjbQ [Bacteroidales bacterium]|nr:secondary thiamine-phosphate synthase enzyme YjbQ [Bacteroidales bacterium]